MPDSPILCIYSVVEKAKRIIANGLQAWAEVMRNMADSLMPFDV